MMQYGKMEPTYCLKIKHISSCVVLKYLPATISCRDGISRITRDCILGFSLSRIGGPERRLKTDFGFSFIMRRFAGTGLKLRSLISPLSELKSSRRLSRFLSFLEYENLYNIKSL